jgi:riboflavin kinase/FMN adenylyltransferase
LNLAAEQELLPARGVYITRTCLDGAARSHRSVTNIGVRPTFNGFLLSVETHLLDAELAAAPKRMEVRFWRRLRDEQKFTGPEELRSQITADIARANKFFSRLRHSRSVRQPA